MYRGAYYITKSKIKAIVVFLISFLFLVSLNSKLFGAAASPVNTAVAAPAAAAKVVSTAKTTAASAPKDAKPAAATAVANAKNAAAKPAATAGATAAAAKTVPVDPKKLAEDAKKKKLADEQAEALKKKNASDAARKAKKQALQKRTRTHTVDVQFVSWSVKASDAEESCHFMASKASASNGYIQRDTIFLKDNSLSKFICTMRVNIKDNIPDTWYLETAHVAGFGVNMQRAYEDAKGRAAKAVPPSQDRSAWVGIDSVLIDSMDDGVLPYQILFETMGKEYVCKIYFRYFKQR